MFRLRKQELQRKLKVKMKVLNKMKKNAWQNEKKGRSEARFGRGRAQELSMKTRCLLMEILSKTRSVFIDWTSLKEGRKLQTGIMKRKVLQS